jgi:hypothetical protein
MILWYNLSDIQRSDNPAKHWQDLVAAAFGQGATSSGAGSASTPARQESLGSAARRANRPHIRPHRRNRHQTHHA